MNTATFRMLAAGFGALTGIACVFAAPPAPAPAPAIPLCPGLTIVTAVAQQSGDYESIKTILSVSDAEVRLKYASESKNTDMLSSGPELKKTNLQRIVLRKDLESATSYQQVFLENSAETIPETTAIGASAAVLRALKTRGSSDFAISAAYSELNLSTDRDAYPNYYSYLQSGTLQRVAGPTSLPVLVNDVPTDLPIVHAAGTLGDDKVEFDFLDDVRNPLTLAFRIGIGGIKPLIPEELELCATIAKSGVQTADLPGGARCDKPKGGDRDTLRVVKLAFRCTAPAPASGPAGGETASAAGSIERELASARKADVYSIYFSFNSDALREESEPTLREIADILRRHPDWQLAVNGHTDGVGGEQYNLDLSKRRAAAVAAALSKRYGIDAKRLSSAGFGKSQPKDTNDTLEGRARNRRVELTRS